mmetsp:Transcript_31020/g.66731  ORF Transcript_31020/g.66731 Transcript_31020/m.66731 type:complete len:482 (-) Transcript_31020:190-1635(-)|eukprot:CAMPEP_0206475914 /NCGR_PEP_ID=MMETSP0324_2-20121206/34380_1 /ASSEMBLY_ACC=CAM_ASM_000836 /TAXON_ID=2866 /ORGANISM="Crypthecodinium cohnii, Strain Seligo" /LENGTH=481 /DNA_ID=CAMNT_0053951397 /DNA_START=71 /DNA_END=1516 /DNA_ORIENTATION=+
MAAPDLAPVPQPFLALPWYNSAPLPNAEPALPPTGDPTELSSRLRKACEQELHCDIGFCHGHQAVQAHRVVLSRNPSISLDPKNTSNEIAVQVPPELKLELVSDIIKAHYLESDLAGKEGTQRMILAALAKPRRKATPTEWAALEAVFGPLDSAGLAKWRSLPIALSAAYAAKQFTDCLVSVPAGGYRFPAHRVILAGTEDGHFFDAAFRWPGQSESKPIVSMPDGLSKEAADMLLKLRYGSYEVQADRILEARHFAAVLDWPTIRQTCEDRLEVLLAQGQGLDAESLLAVVSHAEESLDMPPHLKIGALTAALRQWNKVTEVAEIDGGAQLSASRRAELGVLSRIRDRDGHITWSLEEYLHAAADDLLDWESRLEVGAPRKAKVNMEGAWAHWQQMLFEYGYIFGVEKAEEWRRRVAARREDLRLGRSTAASNSMKLPPGKVWFEPTAEWREVPPNAICPAGLDFRFDMETQKNYARWLP